MFWINLRRIIKTGLKNFRRNVLVSSASILITTITLSVILGLFLFQAVLSNTLITVQEKFDINIAFRTDAPEEEILALQEVLARQPEVAEVQYTSADEEVLNFRERHANDFLTLQALEEIGENPFGGSLRVKAKDSTQYEPIARLLEGDTSVARQYNPIIERINFSQNRVVLDRLSDLIRNTRLIGSLVTYLLALISVVVMYTTIRLTIYMVREEIGIMRLVGASASYVRGPFLVQGILYGALAWIITLALYIPITAWITRTAGDLVGFDLAAYYLDNIVSLAGILLVVGVVLGGVSSFLAVRKYLRV